MGLNESLVSFLLPSSSVSLSPSADLGDEPMLRGLPSSGLDILPSPYDLVLDSTVQYVPELNHQGLTVPEQGLAASDCPAFGGGDGSPLEYFGLFIDEEGREDYQTGGTVQENTNFSPADFSCLMFSPPAGMELGAINSPLEDHLGCHEGLSESKYPQRESIFPSYKEQSTNDLTSVHKPQFSLFGTASDPQHYPVPRHFHLALQLSLNISHSAKSEPQRHVCRCSHNFSRLIINTSLSNGTYVYHRYSRHNSRRGSRSSSETLP